MLHEPEASLDIISALGQGEFDSITLKGASQESFLRLYGCTGQKGILGVAIKKLDDAISEILPPEMSDAYGEVFEHMVTVYEISIQRQDDIDFVLGAVINIFQSYNNSDEIFPLSDIVRKYQEHTIHLVCLQDYGVVCSMSQAIANTQYWQDKNAIRAIIYDPEYLQDLDLEEIRINLDNDDDKQVFANLIQEFAMEVIYGKTFSSEDMASFPKQIPYEAALEVFTLTAESLEILCLMDIEVFLQYSQDSMPSDIVEAECAFNNDTEAMGLDH